MNYGLLYLKELIKYKISKCFRNFSGRLGTPMDYVVLELKSKGYLVEDAEALELFGMFGLWHTMDYLPAIKHLDFFDIQDQYIRYAKRSFKKYLDKVDVYCADSIEYINETDKKYDIVIADTPFNAPQFYDKNGLPIFFNALMNVIKTQGIIIFNIHTANIIKWDFIKEQLEKMVGEKRIKDISEFTRNRSITYIVLVVE